MTKDIKVPRDWLEGLIKHQERFEKNSSAENLTLLLGYIDAARTLLIDYSKSDN